MSKAVFTTGPLQPGIGLSDGKPYRMSGGDMVITGETMPDPSNEDTTQIDRNLIANDLEVVAKTAGRLGYPDMATEIGALVAKYRKPVESGSE